MKRIIVVLALIAGLSAACSSSPKTTSTPRSNGAFPVTVAAANGKVIIPAKPTRIVCVSATPTQMLDSMGALGQVGAVDKYSTDLVPNAPGTNLTGYETGPESYEAFHPDLVIPAQDQSGKLTSELALLHVATLILPPAATLSDTYSQIKVLGQATGHVSQAASEVASISAQLDAIVKATGTRAEGKTYYQELDPTLYSATSKTFIGALYSRLGMKNIADAASSSGNQYPQLSAEYLLQANPDYVFLADAVCCGQSSATYGQRPGFSILQAVKSGHVFTFPKDSIASEWGPNVVEFLQTVANDVTQRTPATTTTT